ncbi:MAG: competence/damage-inducible protein A [Candidatus Aminicenantales bacterium]
MKAEIIAVGTELLTPFFQDTNSLYVTERLNDLGIAVSFKTLVGDDERDLRPAIKTALGRSGLVIVMGGLGPTEDDRTREVFARVLGRKLVLDRKIRAGIRERFRRRGVRMVSTNLKQCYVIEGSEVLENPNGTAPGLWLEIPRHKIALLPGPPNELRPMIDRQVVPRLAAAAKGITIRRTLRLTGIGESLMESRIKTLYGNVPDGISVTTLASPGDLAIHLTYHGESTAAAADALLDILQKRIAGRLETWIYSTGGESLEAVVGSILRERGLTLACAESCTGGLLGHRLTNVPGSSAYFMESAVVYADRAKIHRLGVPAPLIARHGAVSVQVAHEMAAGIRKTSGADFGLAITGVAGPGGGTPRKPVGLVYVALSDNARTMVERSLFWGGREQVKFQSSQKALNMLRKELIKGGKKKYNRASRPR